MKSKGLLFAGFLAASMMLCGTVYAEEQAATEAVCITASPGIPITR